MMSRSDSSPPADQIAAAKWFRPWNTAIRRHGTLATPIGIQLVERHLLDTWGVGTILDYGCGRGEDVDFYIKHGFSARGYDSCPKVKRFAPLPNEQFDLVTCVFVLNVLPFPSERREVCDRIINLCRPGGRVVLTTRSAGAVNRVAKAGWETYKDGYISDCRKHTFQCGRDEIKLNTYVDLSKVNFERNPFRPDHDWCAIVLRRK